jgi:hypothetical protein
MIQNKWMHCGDCKRLFTGNFCSCEQSCKICKLNKAVYAFIIHTGNVWTMCDSCHLGNQ